MYTTNTQQGINMNQQSPITISDEQKAMLHDAIDTYDTPYSLAQALSKLGLKPTIDYSRFMGLAPIVILLGDGNDIFQQRVDPLTGTFIPTSRPITDKDIREGKQQFGSEELEYIDAILGNILSGTFYRYQGLA